MAMPPIEYGHNIQGWKKNHVFFKKNHKIRFFLCKQVIKVDDTINDKD